MTRAPILALALAALSLLFAPAPAFAQLDNAITKPDCNSTTYPSGVTRQIVQTTAGLVCTSASATGTFTDDATGITGNAVPASAAYNGLNVGGNLRGQTGVNPSGSIFAGQIDLTSIGGGIVKVGAGTAAGSLRVELPTDGTGKVGLNASTAVIGHVIVDAVPTTVVTCALCATAAKQPALGTAGTPSADVLTVQGSATGTPLPTVAGGNSFVNITTAATTAAKSGAGVLHTVCVNALGTVASSAVIYDNTAGSGTKIATLNTLALLGCQTYDVAFATGLTLVTTGTVAPDITVSYR